MFFILDEGKRPDIIRDEGRNISYNLLNVVKQPRFSALIVDSDSSSSSDSDEEQESLDVN